VFEDEDEGADSAGRRTPEAPEAPEPPAAPEPARAAKPPKPPRAPKAVAEGFKQWAARWEKRGAEAADRPEREAALRRVRDELVETLRDLGHTITGLGPDEYVASPSSSDLDWRDSTRALQVKRRAIDAFNDGQATAEAAKEVEILTQ
jgi:hypothetical protein